MACREPPTLAAINRASALKGAGTVARQGAEQDAFLSSAAPPEAPVRGVMQSISVARFYWNTARSGTRSATVD